MTIEKNDRRHRRIRVLVGVVLLGVFAIQCQQALMTESEDGTRVAVKGPDPTSGRVAFAAATPGETRAPSTLEERAAQDPIGFFEDALDRYDRTVRDYTCTFTKQELLAGKLSEEQVMQAHFRENPFSVRLKWIKNMDKCEEALYVQDLWINDKSQELAVAVPGPIARLFVSHVMRPIHGEDAQKSSRRTLDQFGLRNALFLALKYVKLSAEEGQADFTYQGKGEVNGRETLVFERRLPYSGIHDPKWPDRVLVVHVDRERMLPMLCTAYADDDKQELLGRYMYTDVELNVGLPDETFTKAGLGLE